jgi:hypothetical protein
VWLLARTGAYGLTSTDDARSRILAAIAEFEGLEPDDEVGLAGEPQELTDAIMAALFPRKKETP